jgi:hypothetical protein
MKARVANSTFASRSSARNNLQVQAPALVTFRRKSNGGQGPPFSCRFDLYRWLYENKRQTWKTYVKLNPEPSNSHSPPISSPQEPLAPSNSTQSNISNLEAVISNQQLVNQKVSFICKCFTNIIRSNTCIIINNCN